MVTNALKSRNQGLDFRQQEAWGGEACGFGEQLPIRVDLICQGTENAVERRSSLKNPYLERKMFQVSARLVTVQVGYCSSEAPSIHLIGEL